MCKFIEEQKLRTTNNCHFVTISSTYMYMMLLLGPSLSFDVIHLGVVKIRGPVGNSTCVVESCWQHIQWLPIFVLKECAFLLDSSHLLAKFSCTFAYIVSEAYLKLTESAMWIVEFTCFSMILLTPRITMWLTPYFGNN